VPDQLGFTTMEERQRANEAERSSRRAAFEQRYPRLLAKYRARQILLHRHRKAITSILSAALASFSFSPYINAHENKLNLEELATTPLPLALYRLMYKRPYFYAEASRERDECFMEVILDAERILLNYWGQKAIHSDMQQAAKLLARVTQTPVVVRRRFLIIEWSAYLTTDRISISDEGDSVNSSV
jgi:hypothetical protein